MIFKLHKNNLPQIKGVVAAFGVCYVHGDGNLYESQEASDFRKDFTNPDSDEATYRAKFEKGDKIPDTIEELQTLMMKNRNKEILETRKVQEISHVKTVTIPVDEETEQPEETVKKAGRPVKIA